MNYINKRLITIYEIDISDRLSLDDIDYSNIRINVIEYVEKNMFTPEFENWFKENIDNFRQEELLFTIAMVNFDKVRDIYFNLDNRHDQIPTMISQMIGDIKAPPKEKEIENKLKQEKEELDNIRENRETQRMLEWDKTNIHGNQQITIEEEYRMGKDVASFDDIPTLEQSDREENFKKFGKQLPIEDIENESNNLRGNGNQDLDLDNLNIDDMDLDDMDLSILDTDELDITDEDLNSLINSLEELSSKTNFDDEDDKINVVEINDLVEVFKINIKVSNKELPIYIVPCISTQLKELGLEEIEYLIGWTFPDLKPIYNSLLIQKFMDTFEMKPDKLPIGFKYPNEIEYSLILGSLQNKIEGGHK